MNYRLCENCREIIYSTGKDYGDTMMIIAAALIFPAHTQQKELETKGLCPFCNPKSVYYCKRNRISQMVQIAIRNLEIIRNWLISPLRIWSPLRALVI